MPPPTYHPERVAPPDPLWAATPEMGQSIRIPPTADAMNDARRMRVPILHPGYENPTGDWVRENIVETWAYYRLPVAHHKHLKSTNMLDVFTRRSNTEPWW